MTHTITEDGSGNLVIHATDALGRTMFKQVVFIGDVSDETKADVRLFWEDEMTRMNAAFFKRFGS